MTDFIKINPKNNDNKICYVNRNYIDTFAYDKIRNETRITTVGDNDEYFEVDGDITNVILDKAKQDTITCKDCKYGVNVTNILGEDRVKCDLSDSFVYRDITLPPDWYCADAERRSE